jgi:hypothetical protein
MNKIFRENLDFLFERFEAHDLCSIVVICLEILSKFVKFGICPYLTLKCSNITVIVISDAFYVLLQCTGTSKIGGKFETDT